MTFNTMNSGESSPKLETPNTVTMTEEEIASQLIAERERLEQAAGLAQAQIRHFRRPEERPFTAEERQRVTILFGGLTWKHEKLIQAVFHGSGYRCECLPNPSLAAYHLGREFGNAAQCNPTYFTVGNLIRYLRGLEARGLSKQEILDNYVFFTCRFVRALPLRNVRVRVPDGAGERRIWRISRPVVFAG